MILTASEDAQGVFGAETQAAVAQADYFTVKDVVGGGIAVLSGFMVVNLRASGDLSLSASAPGAPIGDFPSEASFAHLTYGIQIHAPSGPNVDITKDQRIDTLSTMNVDDPIMLSVHWSARQRIDFSESVTAALSTKITRTGAGKGEVVFSNSLDWLGVSSYLAAVDYRFVLDASGLAPTRIAPRKVPDNGEEHRATVGFVQWFHSTLYGRCLIAGTVFAGASETPAPLMYKVVLCSYMRSYDNRPYIYNNKYNMVVLT